MFRSYFDEKDKLWRGPNLPPLYNPSVSIGQVILRALEVHGPKIAQINDDSGGQMTYADIHIETIRAAQNLQKRGFKSEQVFGIIAKNSSHLAPIVFAAFCIGCPVSTIDTSFGRVELKHMFKTTKPILIFCDVEVYTLVDECLSDLLNKAEIFTFGGQKGRSEPIENLFIATGSEDLFVPTLVNGVDDIATIVCSSGTTGLSKGVCLSHAALLDEVTGLNIIRSSDTVLCFSSLYWVSGMIMLVASTINGAARLITTQSFSPELEFRLIEQYKVSFMFNATHQVVLMLKSELIREGTFSSLKTLHFGGSKVPSGLALEVNKCIPSAKILISYGLSEVGGPITLGNPVLSGNDSVGKLLVGASAKIVDEEGNRCGINVDGEVCWKWNYKFLGYLNDAKATEELFDHEDFIKSGDIGHFDEEGYLFVIDRKKDLIKYFNFHVSPSEIEAFLIQSADIHAACIVGIPDEMGNDLPAAAVVKKSESNINEKQICDMVADHFADCKRLRGGVYFVDSFPTTASGKLLRRKVKDLIIELAASQR